MMKKGMTILFFSILALSSFSFGNNSNSSDEVAVQARVPEPWSIATEVAVQARVPEPWSVKNQQA